MATIKEINTNTFTNWLKESKEVTILDIRPLSERKEWYIPNSIHFDAYDNLKLGDIKSLNKLVIDKSKPVVTICARGKLSQFATEILINKGFDAFFLQGGMNAWNYAFDTAELQFENFTIIQVRRVAKGCLSYIVGSNHSAIVIDASLDPIIYENISKEKGWKIEFVTDTHIHADYISRSRELATQTNATYLFNSVAKVSYPFFPLKDNQKIIIGKIEIRTMHTAGHTWESTTFEIDKKVLLTGDTLFTDGIGRPDLKANEEETKIKVIALFNSLKIISSFNNETYIFPAHTSKSIEINQPIIGEKIGKLKTTINALSLDLETFIKNILSNLPPTPPNYLTIADINKTGKVGDFIIAELEAGANRCAIL